MDTVKLTGLWKEKDADGKDYLSGRLNTMSSVVVVPNESKGSDREPDFFLMFKANPKERPDSIRGFRRGAGVGQ